MSVVHVKIVGPLKLSSSHNHIISWLSEDARDNQVGGGERNKRVISIAAGNTLMRRVTSVTDTQILSQTSSSSLPVTQPPSVGAAAYLTCTLLPYLRDNASFSSFLHNAFDRF